MFPSKEEFFSADFNLESTLQELFVLLNLHKTTQSYVTIPTKTLKSVLPDLPKGELDNGGEIWNTVKSKLQEKGWTMKFQEGSMGGSDYVVFS